MDIRMLEYFLAVAREENITKAAGRLHVTQPTLSRQLMQLEKELGVKLFSRGKHRVTLTKEGLLFCRRAQELIDLANRAKRELFQDEEELSGEIAIGCNETQNVTVLAEMINGFRRRYPRVTFVLRSGNNAELRELLEQGIIDVGLFVEPMNIEKYHFLRLSKKDQWGVLVSEGTEIAAKETVTAKELAGVPMVTIMDEAIHSELTSWSGRYASKMCPIAHYNLLSTAAAIVKGTDSVAVCSKPNCKYEGLTFVAFEPELRQGSLLIWKRNQAMSQLETTFLQYVRGMIREAED